MNAALTEIVQAGRDVLRISFVEPVKEGRPRPADWPAGLRPVGVAVTAVLSVLMLATLVSAPLRRWDTLSVNQTAAVALPSVSIPLLVTAVVLSFAMVLTASLHSPWWLRLSLWTLSGLVTLSFTFTGFINPQQMIVSVVAGVVLVGFMLIRMFRSPTWWEFPVVLGLLSVILLLPWGLPGYILFGTDPRLPGIHGGFIALLPAILPAVMVAGFAPAQIVVTGAQAIADRPVSKGLFWTLFGVAVAGSAVQAYLTITGGTPRTLAGLAASLVELILVGGIVTALVAVARARRPPAAAAYPEAWNAWVYPVAAGIAGITVISWVVSFFASVPLGPTFDAVHAAALAVFYSIVEGNGHQYYSFVLAAVTLVAAWRFARQSRLTEAIMLGTFGVMATVGAIGQLRAAASLPSGSLTEMGWIASLVALTVGAVHVARGRFDRGRATGVLTVLMLNLLYPYRDALSDPITTALTVAPVAMVVFGLLWRVITEAQVTYGASKRYPQATRIFLFMANTLLATTGVAYVALSRGRGTDADSSDFAAIGDQLLGAPLFTAGLVAALWLLLRPHDRGEVVEMLTDESYDPAKAATEDAATEWTPPTAPAPSAPPEPTAWWPPPPPPPPAAPTK